MDARRLDAARDYDSLRLPAGSRFRRTVRRFGQDRGRDLDELAEDYYQEAWLAIERKPAGALVERDPAGYLASTMSNLFLTDVRRRRVETLALEDGAMEVLAAPGDGPDEKAAVSSEMGLAREVVASLPDRERTAFVMRWLYDCGHEEIAATLGVSHRTARLLLEKAGKRLAPAVERVEDGSWCDRYRSTINAIEQGWPIGPTRRDALESHLDHCAHCRAAIGRVRGLAAVTPLPLIGLGLAGAAGGGGLLAAIKGALGLSDKSAGGGGVATSTGAIVAGVAAVAVAGAIGVLVLAPGDDPPRDGGARPAARGAAAPAATAPAASAQSAAAPTSATRTQRRAAARRARARAAARRAREQRARRASAASRASGAPTTAAAAGAGGAPTASSGAGGTGPGGAGTGTGGSGTGTGGSGTGAGGSTQTAGAPATDPTESEFGFER